MTLEGRLARALRRLRVAHLAVDEAGWWWVRHLDASITTRKLRCVVEWLEARDDVCVWRTPYLRAAAYVLGEVRAFAAEPIGWFDEADTLGVDFEGMPPVLVQIACKHGVVVDRLRTAWVRRVLRDPRHLHCIFGQHERRLVARPLDVQAAVGRKWPVLGGPWSLADAASLLLVPRVRLVKDKTIHTRVDWREAARARTLSSEALTYAAGDAWFTRAAGLRVRAGLWDYDPY